MGATSTKGTLLQVEIASVFSTIALVMSLDGPNGEVQFGDTTHLESDYVEDGELTGLLTVGEVTGELFYDWANTGHKRMTSDLAAGGVHRNYKIALPPNGASGIPFEGSVSKFAPKFATKDFAKASFGIKLRSPAEFPS